MVRNHDSFTAAEGERTGFRAAMPGITPALENDALSRASISASPSIPRAA